MTLCKWCQTPIFFQVQDNGRYLPFDFKTNSYHKCPIRPESSIPKHHCNYCKEEIHFDPLVKSYQGKFLPLNKDGTKHWCKENPIAKQQELKKQQKRVAQGLPKTRPFVQEPPGYSKAGEYYA